MRKRPLKERFMEKISIQENGCWEWIAGKDNGGYGRIGCERNHPRAHRVSYQLFRGEIPAGLWVLHKCDNPACVNPDHLFLGTRADNVADMVSKDRQAKGEKINKAKLKAEDIPIIKRLHEQGLSLRAIAMRFSVCHPQILNVIKGRTWKNT